jgi:DNA-binding PadR family transcriptional regulator
VTYERLVSKLTKENLWLYILTELVKQPMYAYEIAKTLKNKHKIPIATVTAYVVLYKMEREGLITVKAKTSRLGRPDRKYYEITDKGRDVLERGKQFLRETLEVISS